MSQVLVVAPHADDETLGCGGTIAKHVANGDNVAVAVYTGPGTSRHPIFSEETFATVRREARQAMDILGVQDLLFRDIPAAMVANQPFHEINQVAHEIIAEVGPEVLYVPFLFDLHKDHRETFHAFSVAWRASSAAGRRIKEIYCYEVNSETHWNIPYVESGFVPGVWSDITTYLPKKMEALQAYHSQMADFPACRSIESVESLAKWRGSQVHVHAAEAFVQVRRLI